MASSCLSLHASPPLAGTVLEGESVPGVSLGFTRAQIVATYGEPSFCQGPTQGFCTYTQVGIGSVNMRYEGPVAGDPLGTDEDVVYNISWSGFTNWVTAAGISTASALADPNSVLTVYPGGTVVTNAQGGIYSIREASLGIQVTWSFNPYSGITTVLMSLFDGTDAAPSPSTLSLQRSNDGSVTLHWPDDGASTLQSCPDAVNGDWTPVADVPVLQDGQNALIVPASGTQMYFRLAK